MGAGQQGDQEEEDLWPGTWFEFTGAVATQRSHNHTKFIFIMLFSLPLQHLVRFCPSPHAVSYVRRSEALFVRHK